MQSSSIINDSIEVAKNVEPVSERHRKRSQREVSIQLSSGLQTEELSSISITAPKRHYSSSAELINPGIKITSVSEVGITSNPSFSLSSSVPNADSFLQQKGIYQPAVTSLTSMPVDAEKNVRDFSRTTALYMVLSMSLGTQRDGQPLREELRKLRQFAYDLARHNKILLVPCMLACPVESDIYKSLERTFFIFCSCLESLCEQLIRNYDLIVDFPLNQTIPQTNSQQPLTSNCLTNPRCPQILATKQIGINTGVSDAFPSVTRCSVVSSSTLSSRQNSILNLRVVGGSRRVSLQQTASPGSENSCVPTNNDQQSSTLEQDELEGLRRDIQSLKETIVEIHSSVRTTPWNVQPEFDTARYRNGDNVFGVAGVIEEDDITDDDISEDEPRVGHVTVKQRRHRCVCLVLVVIISLLLFAIVLGVCIKLLT